MSILVLAIGRPRLVNQWQLPFDTRMTVADLQQAYPHCQVSTYPSPPYFNRQAAQQLLATLTDCVLVALHVSLLELGHQQIVDIFQGITTVLQSASATRLICLYLDYEIDNVEHYDVLELAEAHQQNAYFRFWLHPNRRFRAEPLLLNEGDNGEEMEDDEMETLDDFTDFT